MEDVKNLEKDLEDSKMTLFWCISKAWRAWNSIKWGSKRLWHWLWIELHGLGKYAKGDWNNKIGKQSYKTLYEHDRVMRFVRTAKMYCEQAQKICENVDL